MKPALTLVTVVALFSGPAFAATAMKPAGGALSGKATLSNPRLSTDKAGKSVATGFKADASPVYCVGKVSGPAGTTVSARWFAVKVGKVPANKMILAKDWSSSKANEAFFFTLDAKGKAKPAGDYAVELAVGGKSAKKFTFSIK
jgi:hypothetical protein